MVDTEARINAVRAFNRFITRHVGALNEGLLHSSFSLTETRILYELAHRPGVTASDLRRDLGLDPGYLSRILRNFRERGLVDTTPAPSDARRQELTLTETGERIFAPLNQRSRDEVAAMLAPLSEAAQARLVEAMRTVETLFGGGTTRADGVVLRPHRPGDMGWVIHRHAALYAQEYGWDNSFEAMVAEVAAGFIRNFDPERERCWIAEHDGEPVGSVFVVRADETTAKLRLLYVEPSARGLGIGRKLVDEAVAFARATGCRRIVLWTNDILTAARRIYETAGFTLVGSEKHQSFGHDLVGETWALEL